MKKTIKKIGIATLALVGISSIAVYGSETSQEREGERFVHRLGIERRPREERACFRELLEELGFERQERSEGRISRRER